MSTTSLDQLPITPQPSTATAPQIQLQARETTANQVTQSAAAALNTARETDIRPPPGAAPPSMPTAEQTNALVTGVQEAAANGALRLPARDIPSDSHRIAADAAARPTHVPQSTTPDYIAAEAAQKQSVDVCVPTAAAPEAWHQELLAPVLAAALYFAYQQPAVQKRVLSLSKGMLGANGSPTLAGHVARALIFAALYLGATRAVQYVSIE